MNMNFPSALALVWQMKFDSPRQGIHTSPGDPGGATKGGVIEATWEDAVRAGIVKGKLADATDDQLSTVLRVKFWGTLCDELPHGLDLLMFNGVMMTGRYPKLFQQSLGYMGSEEVDGWVGPQSLIRARSRDPETFIDACSGVHAAYLAGLDTWPRFGGGWTTRLRAVQAAAIAMVHSAPVA